LFPIRLTTKVQTSIFDPPLSFKITLSPELFQT